MRAERICGLSRYLMSLAISAAQTAATQWLERSLDDSVNRRLTLPQAFLATDGVLRLCLNVGDGLVVHPDVIARNIERFFPYMATESILMEAVAQGGDRQELHERIRRHSHAVTEALKVGASRNDLLERLQKDRAFAGVDFGRMEDPRGFVGRAPEQVDAFVAEQVGPVRQRYRDLLGQTADLSV